MNLSLRHHLTLLLTLAAFAACLLAASPTAAEASSLRVSCDVYATNNQDSILGATHDHRQFGNTGHTNSSTWYSLRDNKSSSCENAPYLTSAGWYPVERNEPNETGILYYRAPGDQTRVHALPDGIQLIARQAGLSYNCGAEPLNATATQATPPYGCTDNWATHVRFPSCWDEKGLTPEHTVYGINGSRTNCPSTHPHRIVEVNHTITHKNFDNSVPNPLQVSVGASEWGSWTSMHGDYFFAAQDQVNRNVDLDGDGRVEPYDADGNGRYEPWLAHGDAELNLVDLCVVNPTTLGYANARCRADGLLDAHVRQLKNYYTGKPVPRAPAARFFNPPSASYPYPLPSTTSAVAPHPH